jgi:MoaA/NifB/PqqE/SkfB family radical SAM enzyme
MFDVVLRTGFSKPALRSVAAELTAAGITNLVEVSIRESVPETLVQDILAMPNSHVLFVDDAVQLSGSNVKKLHRYTARQGEGDIFCLNTPLSRRYLQLIGSQSTDSVRASAMGAMHLVPWCALVQKSLLSELDLSQGVTSITALLLALESHAHTILAVGSEPEELDFESWLMDVLDFEHELLAEGIRKLVPEIEVLDPQFRVTSRGRNATLDLALPVEQLTRFSIICPAFKSRFLEDAVRSVLTQTYEEFEFLILVDGPATEEEDAIRAVLGNFQHDPRLKVAYQENRGTGLARAALAEMATGDYLISIDDDDMFVPHTLEYFAKAIAQSDSPTPAALRGGIEIFGFADRYLPPRPRLLIDGIPCDYFEANQPWCLHVPTLRAHGGMVGDPDLRHCGEDADYFLRLDSLPELETLLVDEPLYLRRLSAHNQTLSFTTEEFHAHLKNICANYAPPKYRMTSKDFEEHRPYVRQVTRYHDIQTRRQVITATRYFDYSLTSKSAEAIIDLELTALCNADCTFCPREHLGRTNKYLPMEVVERIAEELRHDGIRRKIVLCGIGEPTLHPEVVNIVRILTEAGAEVCMTNNGSRMDTDRFTNLAEAGLQEVNFSVNATTDETRQLVMKQKNFERVRQNVRDVLALRDAQFPHIEVHLSFVLCPQNQHEVDDFVREWRDCTANALWIHPVNNRANLLTSEYGQINAEEVARRYSRDPRVIVDLWDHGFAPDAANLCSVVQATQFITSDGDILLCALDHERKNILGNVMSKSLVRLQTEKLDRYRHGHFNEFCEGCTYCPRTHKSLAALH